jgi:hypothetical protein
MSQRCPTCDALLTPRDHIPLRRRVAMEPDHDETIAVVAWRCPGCASTVWQRDGLVAEPPQPEPPEVRSPVADSPPPNRTGWLLGINAVLILGCAFVAAVSEHWPLWLLGAAGLLVINYAIYRRDR